MENSRVGARREKRILVALLLLLALLVMAPAPASAAASTPRAAASSDAPSAYARAAQATGLADTICDLLKKPVSYGVNRLITLMTNGRIRGNLAGSLFSEIGFKPWCRKAYPKLQERLQQVAQRKRSLRPRLGIFVFNLRASYSVLSATVDRFQVTWSEFSPYSPLRHYFLYYRINETRWVPMSRKILYISRGQRVQFAVRVDNRAGVSSPWTYSVNYRVP